MVTPKDVMRALCGLVGWL